MTSKEFAFLAPAEPLTSNQRLHFHEKAKRTKAWRDMTASLVPLYRVPSFTRAHITFTVQFTSSHHRDVGNYYATAKACVDGLVDAGVLPDDCDCYVTGPDMRRGPKIAPPGPVVTIRLEEIA